MSRFNALKRHIINHISKSHQVRKYSSTVEEAELPLYRRLSSEWWSLQGPFKLLHSMNELRVPLVANSLTKESIPSRLKGYKILDVGCGGGILSEAFSRIGASVTGIDPVQENIAVAKYHASHDPNLQLRYLCTTIEELAVNEQEQYDAIIASEVVEHVINIDIFIENCVRALKPEGRIFITTINRTLLSYALAIVAAENILKLVPKETHQWNKFVLPQDLTNLLTKNGCSVTKVKGMGCNPITGKWDWIPFTDINYAIEAVKTTTKPIQQIQQQ